MLQAILLFLLLLQRTAQSWILSSTLSNNANIRVTALVPPTLTVLIPAYNEEFRITETLEQYSRYFSESLQWKNRTSIVVVDDGSSDDTARVVRACTTDIPTVCLEMPANRGKGAALAYGIQYIVQTNERNMGLIVTADADGSARISDVEVLFRVLQDECSADAKTKDSCWKQSILINGFRTYDAPSALRLFFRWGFRAVVRVVCGDLQVQDTQCGFKLMTFSAAEVLYSNLNLPGWSHDVEVLYRAKQRGIRVREASILWQDKDGSKLVSSPGGVLVVCGEMFAEVVRLRYNYEMGNWSM